MPKNMIDLLDKNRGDTTRSKYVWRILETTLNENINESKNLGSGYGIGHLPQIPSRPKDN